MFKPEYGAAKNVTLPCAALGEQAARNGAKKNPVREIPLSEGVEIVVAVEKGRGQTRRVRPRISSAADSALSKTG
ncbi:hypothetical protein ACFFTM_06020 [Pseudoduganella plicata]|uniref:AbrB/MazE/SpoVT family DNA-binding domain-containing protein n=1 Tax=Pseudoduganella plicata TaxID=321984 RepID=A0ABX5SES5_9BURK|nr:hypothetical protein [Pseudoduganella plicata]QBQ38597.1 hypothetical protein E1742_22280 [Pseudoduganella plicata]